MNQELQDKLYKDFPSLFINDRFDGFWVPDGWHDLIYNLSKDISALNLNVHVVQIKIKFGGLRYYLHEHHSEIEKLIGVAEERSYYTCECCGKYKQKENKLCDTCSIIKNNRMNINYLNHTLVKLYLTPSERICFSKEDLICTVCNVLIRFSERGMYYSGEIGSGYKLTCEEQQIKNIIE